MQTVKTPVNQLLNVRRLSKTILIERLQYYIIDWLIDWLVLNSTSALKAQFVATAGAEKPAQSAKDGQRDTKHNTSRYTITM